MCFSLVHPSGFSDSVPIKNTSFCLVDNCVFIDFVFIRYLYRLLLISKVVFSVFHLFIDLLVSFVAAADHSLRVETGKRGFSIRV